MFLPTEIIVDGEIVERKKEMNLDKEPLQTQLKNHGISSVDDVFYAEVQNNGVLHIDRRE